MNTEVLCRFLPVCELAVFLVQNDDAYQRHIWTYQVCPLRLYISPVCIWTEVYQAHQPEKDENSVQEVPLNYHLPCYVLDSLSCLGPLLSKELSFYIGIGVFRTT